MAKFFINNFSSFIYSTAQKDIVPDSVLSLTLSQQLTIFLEKIGCYEGSLEEKMKKRMLFIEDIRQMPIILSPLLPLELPDQRLPSEAFQLVVGRHLTFHSGLWDPTWAASRGHLEQATEAMMESYCARAEIVNGMRILDLTAGFGALSLFLGIKYSRSHIIAVTENDVQTQYINEQVQQHGLRNVRVVQQDLNTFSFGYSDTDEAQADFMKCFYSGRTTENFNLLEADRIIISTSWNIKNVGEMFQRVSSWLAPKGLLFVHAFTHTGMPGHFDDFLEETLFPKGTIFSASTFLRFQDHLVLKKQWVLDGWHGSRTAEAWLHNLDNSHEEAIGLIQQIYGLSTEVAILNRWRKCVLMFKAMFDYSANDFHDSFYLFESR